MPVLDKRPVFLNLARIQMPVMAVVSIGHRISGLLLFLALPVIIYLLALSLESSAGYARVTEFLGSTLMRLVAVILIWALAHHLFAGIRFLLLDMSLGIDLATARRTAWWVHAGGIAALILAAGLLLR